MKNSYLIYIFTIILLAGCKKDEPVINVHSGLTRIDYEVKNPFEMPHVEFAFNDIYDLSGHSLFSIEILTTEESGALNLMIMLEDENGNKNDEQPITLSETDLTPDSEAVKYLFDLQDYLGSVTSSTGEIDLSHTKKILIYINAGISGKLSSGKFWLDTIEFTRPS